LNAFTAELKSRLDKIREQGLFRELRRLDSPQTPGICIGGKALLNFSSNDYLGLANHPRLKEAAMRAVEKFGAGSGASRLICGSLAPHHELENALAAFKGCEAALTFSSGWAAAFGAIGALMDKEDVVVLDKLAHASLIDAAKLSGARLRVFHHNDLNELEDILRWVNESPPEGGRTRRRRALIVTESVFSMDGDTAPLREIAAIKNRYGAWLMVDEAHATGLHGASRRGLAEEAGIAGDVEVQMGTLGKALGASGGYICGPRDLIDYLINRSRSFIFSTAPVPAAAGAAHAAIELVQSREGQNRAEKLWALADTARTALVDAGWELAANRSAILPLRIGEETAAVQTASALRAKGIYIPAIRFPSVARGQARLRLTLTAAHEPGHIETLLGALPPSPRARQSATPHHA